MSIKIGLFDVDSHNFPNLALLKISAWHKHLGHNVEWWSGLNRYDIVYKSKVFDDTYSADDYTAIQADKVFFGGTGYGLDNKLPDSVEHTYPDYGLYPQYQEAYGFLTRGCPCACTFCIVSEKEGCKSRQVADLYEFWQGQKSIKLLDPNLLACPEHEALLRQLAASRAYVDFTQGLDIRLITADNVALLNRIKIKMLHFAWDNPEADLTPHFQRFLRHTTLKDQRKRRVYVLANFNSTTEQDLERIYTLRGLGFDPYVMIYDKPHAPHITRQLQRWVNNKRIFWSCSNFEQYGKHKK